MGKKSKKSTKKSAKKWSIGRRFAFLAVVALWSAGLYALVWLVVSTFVSADVVSHYYADLDLSRWWGALFVPIYFVIVAVLYLFALPVSKYNSLLFVPLLAGLICGIITTFVGSLDAFFDAATDLVHFFGLCAIVACFFSFVIMVLCKRDSIKFVCFCFAALAFGAATGVSIFYISPVGYLCLLGACVLFLFAGFVFGVLVGVIFALLATGLVRLHIIAFGLPANKDEDNEEE